MSALWSLSDMAVAMRATKSGALPTDITGISIDSRTAAKGDAFFAIQGDNRDGHEFVEAALKGGAGSPQVIAYSTAWALYAIHRLVLYEVPMMPPRVVWLRALACLPLPLIAAGFAVMVGKP